MKVFYSNSALVARGAKALFVLFKNTINKLAKKYKKSTKKSGFFETNNYYSAIFILLIRKQMTKPVILKNDLIYVRLEEKELLCKDSKDFYNEQTFFTKSLRGVKKLIEYAKENFNEKTTFRQVGEWCDKFNVRTHYYCTID